jgi:GNAT superfamily N-acetyltransferase
MQITRANAEDLDDLASLLTILFSQEAEFVPDRAAQLRGLERIVRDPGVGVILIARSEGKAVGMVNLLFTISTALGERVAILEDMVVTPEGRGGVVGSRLLEAVIEVAKAERCRRITLLTDGSNVAAQRFYARQGFTLSGMVPMRLPLLA